MVYKYLFTDELMPIDLPRNFTFSSYNSNPGVSKSDEEKSQKKLNNKTNRSHTNTESSTFDYMTGASKNSLNSHNSSANSTISPKLPEVSKKQGSNPPLK